MKKTLCAFLLLLAITSCKKEETPDSDVHYDAAQAYDLSNIAYGDDAKQKMDVYLPANRDSISTKVFVLIHGGGWSAGDKADYTSTMASFKTYYPDHAIININYRLGTVASPGYPKQIQDISAALAEIQRPVYGVSEQYCLYGGSAGGHLSMLYAYAFDPGHYVKGVINTVGPTDFSDPALLGNTVVLGLFATFIGNAAYDQAGNQSLFTEVSPAARVTPAAPPTISFYGDQDPLIPTTQVPPLRAALQANNLWHYDTIYPGGGHAAWATYEQYQDNANRVTAFVDQFFD